MGKFRKYYRKPKKRKRKKKFIIEIRTNRGWKRVELLDSTGPCVLVKCINGEILRRKFTSRIRWGKTKLILKGGRAQHATEAKSRTN